MKIWEARQLVYKLKTEIKAAARAGNNERAHQLKNAKRTINQRILRAQQNADIGNVQQNSSGAA